MNSAPHIVSKPRCVLSCGSFKLLYDKAGDALWMLREAKGSEATDVNMSGPMELCGFGSGDFVSGPELWPNKSLQ